MLATYIIKQDEPRTNFYGQTVCPFELTCYLDGEYFDLYRSIDREQLEDIAADFVRSHTEP